MEASGRLDKDYGSNINNGTFVSIFKAKSPPPNTKQEFVTLNPSNQI